jgi:tetraacyldisaccharide 4'-kinase
MNRWLQQLPRYWQSTSAVTYLLWPIECLYRFALFVNQGLYATGLLKSHSVNATVIVVGNVVAGGGGKTPLTLAIVQRLLDQGHKVGVVSRGYGRKNQTLQFVNTQSLPHEVGDEPLLIFQKCKVPVVVSANRVEAATQLLRKFPDTQFVVCDDGLQHSSLKRDIEICVMDAMGIGNGHLLPAGPLREPWPRPCDLLLHTHARTFPEGFESKRALSQTLISIDGQLTPLSQWAGQAVEVVSGIAKPQAFHKMLEEANIRIQVATSLPDHDDFSSWAPKQPNLTLLCTEKDAVKLWAQYPNAMAVPLIFEPEKAFWIELEARIRSVQRYH